MTARTEISPLARACATAEYADQPVLNVSADSLRTCERLVHELPAMIMSVNGHGHVTGANPQQECLGIGAGHVEFRKH